MNEHEIFTNIIAKGMFNGWVPRPDVGDNFQWGYEAGNFCMRTPIWDTDKGEMGFQMGQCSIEKVLFDPAFACALWGDVWTDEEMMDASLPTLDLEPWQYHLQKLAISKNRTEYLKPFTEIKKKDEN